MKKLGKFWNDKELSVYEIDGIKIVLNGWNGDKWTNCFELAENETDIIKEGIEVRPEYKELENGDFELINLIIL